MFESLAMRRQPARNRPLSSYLLVEREHARLWEETQPDLLSLLVSWNTLATLEVRGVKALWINLVDVDEKLPGP